MTESLAPWTLPLCLSVAVIFVSGVLIYSFGRLEMNRENAWSIAVVSIAAQISIMAIWVLTGASGV